jgi:predicted acetyltransferase
MPCNHLEILKMSRNTSITASFSQTGFEIRTSQEQFWLLRIIDVKNAFMLRFCILHALQNAN